MNIKFFPRCLRVCIVMMAVVLLYVIGLPVEVNAASQNIKVTVPRFSVTINNEIYDNAKALYPLLTYKDITYFPMTYSMTRQMGLVSAWDNSKGLFITQHTESYEERDPFNSKNVPGMTFNAVIPTYSIYVNGTAIDNSKEEYPIFNYNNITYFPLTWRFVHDEFGWNGYEFSQSRGLIVSKDYISQEAVEYNSYDLVGMGISDLIIADYKSVYSKSGDDNNPTFTLMSDGTDYYKFDFAEKCFVKAKTPEKTMTDEWGNLKSRGDFVSSDSKGTYDAILTHTYTMTSGAKIIFEKICTSPGVPAPYTAYDNSVWIIPVSGNNQGQKVKVNSFLTSMNFGGAYETNGCYWVWSSGRNLAGRFNSGDCTLICIDKQTGEETIINDKYREIYGSIKPIGCDENNLYVLATYYGSEEDKQSYEHTAMVRPDRDGFFVCNSSGDLAGIAPYVDGEAVVGSDGEIYVVSSDRLMVTVLGKDGSVTRITE